MSLHPDHRTFNDAAPIPTTTAEPRPKHYLAPVAKLDFLLAKDIDPDLSPMARRVLTVILAHRNKDTGEAYPGEDEIARILGTTRRQSITDAVKELVDAGWITKQRKTKPSRTNSIYGSNHYTVLTDKVAAILVKAGISFTNGRCKTDDPGTVLRETNARFCVPEDNGKPYHNQPTEPAKVNPPKVGEDKTRPDAGAPALTARPVDASLLDGDQDPEATSVPKRMSFNDEYDILVSRFPGNSMGTIYRGAFCGIRQRGFTLDDVLVALEYDTKLANSNGEARCMASFLDTYFTGQDAPGDVQHWKDRLAEHKRKLATANVRSRPKTAVPRAVLEMAAERRAQEAARARVFNASARARVEALDADDDDDRENRKMARRLPFSTAEEHAPF